MVGLSGSTDLLMDETTDENSIQTTSIVNLNLGNQSSALSLARNKHNYSAEAFSGAVRHNPNASTVFSSYMMNGDSFAMSPEKFKLDAHGRIPSQHARQHLDEHGVE